MIVCISKKYNQKNFMTYRHNDFDFLNESGEIQQNNKKFVILKYFNINFMQIQIKRATLHNEIFHNHASKKYEIIFCKSIIACTSQQYIQNNFMTHSRNGFDC